MAETFGKMRKRITAKRSYTTGTDRASILTQLCDCAFVLEATGEFQMQFFNQMFNAFARGIGYGFARALFRGFK